ncbi:hypothetical protein ABBQ38_013674 [Trebouxia sp. C0009 RCD-2024]
MSSVSAHYLLSTNKHGLVGRAALGLRKHRRPKGGRCVAERRPCDRDTFESSDREPPVAYRPRKFTSGHTSRQDEKNSPSASQQAFDPKPFTRTAACQTMSIQHLKNPWQITTFITQIKKAALNAARGPRPEEALTGFCGTMDALLTAAGFRMNHINFAAVITALAHVWEAAQRNHRFRAHASTLDKVEALHQRYVQSSRPLLADMAARSISTVLWSSAKLGFNLDATVPGMVHDMTLRFVNLLLVVEEKQLPNAQECANLVWALATMGHPAATTKVVDPVCLRFTSLTRHADMQQRPTAQGAANVLWALATMGHPAAAGVLDTVATHFAHLLGNANAKQRPHAQEVANVVWALGTLKHTPPDDGLLDAFLAYFHVLLRSEDQRTRPDAQSIANTLWALKELKQAPSHDVVCAMLDSFVVLCQTPSLQPTSQGISNCLLACAELRLSVRSACVKALLKHLIEVDVSRVERQSYCNVAWSLAVIGCLTVSMLDALLRQMSAKGASMQPPKAQRQQLQQLHQALAWLKPASGSQQMEAWSSLRSRLQAVAPEPAVVPVPSPGQAEVYAALAMQAVPYTAQVPYGTYWAHAVLSSSNNEVPKVLLMVELAQEYITNIPSRFLGHVVFRNEMLGRYGTVVTVPYDPDRSSVEIIAGGIKAAVEAKTGLPLDSFRY